jgi:hypothetical protein
LEGPPFGDPIHASWLNQAEICLSVVHGKVLKLNNVEDLADLADRPTHL